MGLSRARARPLRRLLQYVLRPGEGFASPDWFRSSVPRGLPEGTEKREVLVLSPGPVPTTSFYVEGRLPPGCGKIFDTRASALPGAPRPGSEVVVVRYAPRQWLQWIRRHRDALRRVVLLMDDDMPQALLAAELPTGYALRTAWRLRDSSRLLEGCCDEVWLSTPELLARYPGRASRLVEPVCMPFPPECSAGGEAVYFYHGTRAHLDEIHWLLPVVQRVQRLCPWAVFEVFGNAEVVRIFRGVPGVRVHPWLPWPEYLAYTGSRRYRVGLAPCLDTPFNRARSAVKVFDITRLGAAGVYSDLAPYAGMIRQGETGFLLGEDASEWASLIARLLASPDESASLAAAARRDCELHRTRRSHWPSASRDGVG